MGPSVEDRHQYYLRREPSSLRQFNFITAPLFQGYSGGPVSQKVGDHLAASGVNLKSIYGGTEFGAPCLPHLERGHEEDWDFVEFSSRAKIRWVDEGNGRCECQFWWVSFHPQIRGKELTPKIPRCVIRIVPLLRIWRIREDTQLPNSMRNIRRNRTCGGCEQPALLITQFLIR